MIISFPFTLLSLVLTSVLFDGHRAVVQSISVESHCDNELVNIRTIGEFLGEFLPQLKAKIASVSDRHYFKSDPQLKRCVQDEVAIDVLAQLVEPEKDLQDVCHPNHIEEIIKYHNRFIITNYLDPEQSNRPAITNNLFKSYATHVSYVCKKNSIANLKSDISTRKLNDDLMESITPWLENINKGNEKKEGSSLLPIDSIGCPLQDLVGDLLLPKWRDSKDELIKMSFESEAAFYKLQSTCLFRLRPIYATTIMPIVQLAKLGYSYQGPELAELSVQDEVMAKRWYTVAQICEIFRQIDLGMLRYRKLVVRPYEENEPFLDNQMAKYVHENNAIRLNDQLKPTSEVMMAQDNNSEYHGRITNQQKKGSTGFKTRMNDVKNSLMSNCPWEKQANANQKLDSSNKSMRWKIMNYFHQSIERTKSPIRASGDSDQNRDLLAELLEILATSSQ